MRIRTLFSDNDLEAIRQALRQPGKTGAYHPSIDSRHDVVAFGGRNKALRGNQVAVGGCHAHQELTKTSAHLKPAAP